MIMVRSSQDELLCRNSSCRAIATFAPAPAAAAAAAAVLLLLLLCGCSHSLVHVFQKCSAFVVAGDRCCCAWILYT